MLNNYISDRNGVIKQIKKEPFSYDRNYIYERYDSYSKGSELSNLRLGFLIGTLGGYTPKSLLDVGYGNGDFLYTAASTIKECYGFDIEPAYPIEEPILRTSSMYKREYDVVCFFDSLEHFEDIYEIRLLKTKYIMTSVPNCHNISINWFKNWKHRRPNEHLWHFNEDSITSFFNELGYENLVHSNIEDSLRKPYDKELSNILTSIFKKKND